MAESPIVARIRKLLAMTEEAGCSPAEAAEAMRRANELMTQHNIAIGEVGVGHEETIIEDGFSLGDKDPRRYNWCLLLAGALGRLFGTMPLRGMKASDSRRTVVSITFIGQATDVQVSLASLRWLIDLADRGWRSDWNQSRMDVSFGVYRASWLDGFVKAIKYQVDEILAARQNAATEADAAMFAIVACKEHEIERYLEDTNARLGSFSIGGPARVVDEAYVRGVLAGQAASINPMSELGRDG